MNIIRSTSYRDTFPRFQLIEYIYVTRSMYSMLLFHSQLTAARSRSQCLQIHLDAASRLADMTSAVNTNSGHQQHHADAMR